jgi:hypothetical protein
MVKSRANEKWKTVEIGNKSGKKYAVSNQGRIASFTDKLEDGEILKGSNTKGFILLKFKLKGKKGEYNKNLFVHRLVAEKFIANSNKKKTYVLHKDHKLSNNNVSNLKWATYEEMVAHKKTNPRIIASQKRLTEFNKNAPGHKLTLGMVKEIKRKIANPNRKTSLKKIAEQFDISEMQLYRIKSGENWGHVKV